MIDWEAPIQEKQNFNNQYVDSEAEEVNNEPLKNCFK